MTKIRVVVEWTNVDVINTGISIQNDKRIKRDIIEITQEEYEFINKAFDDYYKAEGIITKYKNIRKKGYNNE